MKIKIAFYIESMVVGGAERVLIDTVNNMNPEKYDITVIAIFKNSVYGKYNLKFKDLFHSNVHFRYLIDNSKSWKYTLFNYSFAHFNKARVYSKYIKEQFDIEVSCYEGLPTEFLAYSTNKHSKKVAWLQTDNARIYKNCTEAEIKAINEMYKRFDCVVGSSSRVVESFLELFSGVPTKMVHNVFQSDQIVEKSFQPCELPIVEIPTFVAVGRLTTVKGYDRLINAAAALHREKFQFRLIMLGEGELREIFQTMISENELENTVFLLGNQDNPYSYMRNGSYFVCSSVAEGFSTVVVEAILCDLPVLTTNVSGMKDIFGDCECGQICENSEEGIYKMLKNQLQHPELREKYVKKKKKRKEFFSIEKRMRDIEALYDEVLNE